MSRTLINDETTVFDHPIEHVWTLVSNFGAIKAWMPYIRWCQSDGTTIGSVRTILSFTGEVRERLEILDHDKHILSYRMLGSPGLPMQGMFGTWKMEESGSPQTLVTWIADAEEIDEKHIPLIKTLLHGTMIDAFNGLKKALT